ncbi:MAG: DinB family protein [Bacteroidia bacterium]|nr:DinB family protein [Bacteroidia bacterium]
METSLIDTWEINNRINLYLLKSVKEEYLTDALVSKGRNTGQQFAHMHNVRLMWLKVAKPELMEVVSKIEKEDRITKELLHDSLTASTNAMTQLLQEAFIKGRVKNFKPHPQAFLGYLIAHEAHHRAQIILALKQSGHPIDKKVQYGLWEWGVR